MPDDEMPADPFPNVTIIDGYTLTMLDGSVRSVTVPVMVVITSTLDQPDEGAQ